MLHSLILFHIDILSFQVNSENVDLNTDTSLIVDISDALSEREKVKFTVQTKVCTSCDIYYKHLVFVLLLNYIQTFSFVLLLNYNSGAELYTKIII